MSASIRRNLIWPAQVGLLAGLYVVTSKIGIALTLPTGVASAIWPAAGVSMAALLLLGVRCWPGIFLGALSSWLLGLDALSMRGVCVAAGVASGATLQAVMGFYLCRRFLRFPNALDDFASIGRLLLFGAMLPAMISSSAGHLTLLAAGMASPDSIAAQWLVWWLGDALGVATFTPPVLLLFTRSSSTVRISRQRKWAVIASMLAVIMTVVVVFFLAKDRENQQRLAYNESRSTDLVMALQTQLENYLSILIGIDAYLQASEFVSFDEFQTYTREYLDRYPGIQALSWHPEIKQTERSKFVTLMQGQGFEAFDIRDRESSGVTNRAGERPVYYPVAYVVPLKANRGAMGIDTYAPNPNQANIRIGLMDQAKRRDHPVSTGRISLVHREAQYGLAVYHPVFASARTTLETRPLLGYAVGVFVIPEMLRSTRDRAAGLGLDFALFDRSATPASQFLYASSPRGEPENAGRWQQDQSAISQPLSFAQHNWELITFDRAGTAHQYGWMLWSVLTGGFLAASLIGVLVLLTTARTDIIQKTVEQRTAELIKANRELEEFAYRTSHDLRSPLVSSIGLLEHARSSIDPGDRESLHVVSMAGNALQRLEGLVSDILDLTRSRHLEEAPERVRLIDLAVTVTDHARIMPHADRVAVSLDVHSSLELITVRSRLESVLENLVSNAIKYQDFNCSNPWVKIAASATDEWVLVDVIDNGIGIAPAYGHRVFGMFERFHPKVSFGSGLGLYMIRQNAELMGGDVAYTDTGKGSRFTLRIPITRPGTLSSSVPSAVPRADSGPDSKAAASAEPVPRHQSRPGPSAP